MPFGLIQPYEFPRWRAHCTSFVFKTGFALSQQQIKKPFTITILTDEIEKQEVCTYTSIYRYVAMSVRPLKLLTGKKDNELSALLALQL